MQADCDSMNNASTYGRETRPLLCDFARIAEPLRGTGMAALTMRP